MKIRSDGKYMNACDDQVECPYAVFAERARSNFADVAKECGFKNEGIKVQES